MKLVQSPATVQVVGHLLCQTLLKTAVSELLAFLTLFEFDQSELEAFGIDQPTLDMLQAAIDRMKVKVGPLPPDDPPTE